MIRRHPRAIEAIIDQALFISGFDANAANRFIDAVEQSLLRLQEWPEIGKAWESNHPELAGVRWWPVEGFPNVLIFYRPNIDGIDLIHLLHGSRDLRNVLAELDDDRA